RRHRGAEYVVPAALGLESSVIGENREAMVSGDRKAVGAAREGGPAGTLQTFRQFRTNPRAAAKRIKIVDLDNGLRLAARPRADTRQGAVVSNADGDPHLFCAPPLGGHKTDPSSFLLPGPLPRRAPAAAGKRPPPPRCRRCARHCKRPPLLRCPVLGRSLG